jgi:hypothetical protein
MTKTGFTFTSMAEAETAWNSMRQFLHLASKVGATLPARIAASEALEVMDKIGDNVEHG